MREDTVAEGTEDLKALAAAYGVETSYTDWRGRPADVSVTTISSVLTALGADVSSSEAVGRELERIDRECRARLLPSVAVVFAGEDLLAADDAELWVELATGDELRLHRAEPRPSSAAPQAATAGGPQAAATAGRPPATSAEATGFRTAYRLPLETPLGWHRVRARRGDREEAAPLLVAPSRAPDPGERSWGLMAQLYSLRSTRSWGMGDLADLRELAAWSGRALGAGFVLVNPLHAGEPAPPVRPSPYLPVSRRYTSPLYLRPEDVSEYTGADPEVRRRVAELAAPEQARSRTTDDIDRDAVWTAKRAALELLVEVPLTPERAAAYAGFREREGEELTAFATWCALAEEHGSSWPSWPADLRDPRSAAVAAERERRADRVEFHRRLQWWLDEQLGAVHDAAREAGMDLGIVHDLAVGVDPGGADAWAYRDLFAPGMSVGAPPDEFNQRGQDWGQPPWHPQRLAAAGYAPYRAMLRHVLRHAGGLRLDHAMQVFRLWWVPQGASPADGTYVSYPYGDLLGVLLAEAHEAGAVVIGEDLGTVADYMRDVFAERGVFGTSMAWFERDESGAPLPPGKWRELCLATVGTHDMPPIEGYLNGDHIVLRERLGLLTRPAAEEYAELDRSLREWKELLTSLGLDTADMTAALHAFLARTPARLIGVSLADAVGERRTQNQPGTVDEYPNWRIPLADAAGRPVLLDDLPRHPRLPATLGPVLDQGGAH
ncbi:4-alpha-glucanotransferase [Actinoallomurus purpureus]|uniref:4-alpha-glucanotransferase n=1 Tax=Actinoallomurus purpureus TaxID=478114 RepID=UPI002092B890|nr:4-alpha-glucanotransferase [Actinoallomurus purpureus]MCO6010228.1 4-alpha-glucanotransferase [Actinoallomurus purpureus]